MARNANSNASMSVKKLQEWLDYEEDEPSLDYLLEEEDSAPAKLSPIAKKEEAAPSAEDQGDEERLLKGQISSAYDEALIGVEILLEGIDRGVVTDMDGGFSINVPIEGASLLISSLGFESKRVEIEDQSFVEIQLEEKIELSAVVVEGDKDTGEADTEEEEENPQSSSEPKDKEVKSRSVGKSRSMGPRKMAPPPRSQASEVQEVFIPVSPEESEENLVHPVQRSRSLSPAEQAPPPSPTPVMPEPVPAPIPPKRTLKERVADWSEQKGEPGIEHFYKYLAWHPSFIQRLVVIIGTILLLVTAFFTYRFFSTPPPVAEVYQRVEGIKRLGELHLVKQHYESIIPILKGKKKENGEEQDLQFLLIAPVEVSGYLDFSKIKLDLQKDSLAVVSLPEPSISEVYLDFRKTEEFLSKGKLRIFGKYVERLDFKTAYYDIAIGINENKKKVAEQAKINGIEDETTRKAELFLRNFLNSLGYRVEFKVAEKKAEDKKEQKEANEATSDINQS